MTAQPRLPVHTASELRLGGIFFLFLAVSPPRKLWFIRDGGRAGEEMRAYALLPAHTAHELCHGTVGLAGC